MKKKKILLLLINSLLLFSCKKTEQRTYVLLPDEVEGVVSDNEVNYVKVGDMVNIESLVRFEKAMPSSYTLTLTKNSLNYAIISSSNPHVIEFLKEGEVNAIVTTDNNKQATLKFIVYSETKAKFLDYISDIEKNYAFVSINSVSQTKEVDGQTITYNTYETVDGEDVVKASDFQTIHNSHYFLYNSSSYSSSKNYSGYLKDGGNSQVYKFEIDALNNEEATVLPGDLGSDYEDYIFAGDYSISSDLISTYEDEDGEKVKIDLSSDVSLSTKLLTGSLGLLARRKQKPFYIVNYYMITQGDHINVEFKDVQYVNTKGETVTKNVPVYSIYYHYYKWTSDEDYEEGQMNFVGQYYALLKDDEDIKVDKVQEYIDSKNIPDKLMDDTFTNILESVLTYNNYSLGIQGLWYDENGYGLASDDIPKLSNKNLFDNFQDNLYFTENKIKEEIVYGYLSSSIRPTYIYESQEGDDAYYGEYTSNSKKYTMTYNDNDEKLEIKDVEEGSVISYSVRKETIDDNSFYLYYVDTSKNTHQLKFVTDGYVGIYAVYEDNKKIASLSYTGNAIKLSSNVSSDGTISKTYSNNGFYLKDSTLYKSSDVLSIKNPLKDVYDNYIDKVELQKVSTVTSETNNTKTITINISKMDSITDMFLQLVKANPIDGEKESEFLGQERFNIYGEKITYASYFSPSIKITYKDLESTVPYQIYIDFDMSYDSREGIYYHIGFNFYGFNSTTIE